jgi:hypothetical protein
MVAGNPVKHRRKTTSSSAAHGDNDATIAARSIGIAREKRNDTLSNLSKSLLEELRGMNLSYPGWASDLADAVQVLDDKSKNNAQFYALASKIKEQQSQFENELKPFNRLNELVELKLTYPGYEQDVQSVEEWLIRNENDDKTFHDKLQGLKNKEALFRNDRSHPNIKELDNLALDYIDWEADYQRAVSAHCDCPEKLFPAAIHTLREKQNVHEGNRSHWRLVQLDTLRLSYPGSEDDLKAVEVWHFENRNIPANTELFMEAFDGMRDQERLFQASQEKPEPHETLATVRVNNYSKESEQENPILAESPVVQVDNSEKPKQEKPVLPGHKPADWVDDSSEKPDIDKALSSPISSDLTDGTIYGKISIESDSFSAASTMASTLSHAFSQPALSEDEFTKLFHESAQPIKA